MIWSRTTTRGSSRICGTSRCLGVCRTWSRSACRRSAASRNFCTESSLRARRTGSCARPPPSAACLCVCSTASSNQDSHIISRPSDAADEGAGRLRTFHRTRLVLDSGSSQNKYEAAMNQLIVTHASNKECLSAIIGAHRYCRTQSLGSDDFRGGLILISDTDPATAGPWKTLRVLLFGAINFAAQIRDAPDPEVIRGLAEFKIPSVWVKKGDFGPAPQNKTDPFRPPQDIDAKGHTREHPRP
eukprot:2487229-Rhodomonas_salina.1